MRILVILLLEVIAEFLLQLGAIVIAMEIEVFVLGISPTAFDHEVVLTASYGHADLDVGYQEF